MTKDEIQKLKNDNPPSPHIKDKFEVVGVIPGLIKIDGRQYDLRNITAGEAEELVNRKGGCRVLKRVEPTSRKTTEK